MGPGSLTSRFIKINPNKFCGKVTEYLLLFLDGPDMIRFTPNHVRYNIREGENLEPVKCTANCTPTCNFKWTKIGESNFARNTPFFDLVNLSRTDAGTNRCIAIWLDIITITKDLEVNVECEYLFPNDSYNLYIM
jgi:hypothetical protein